MDWGFGKNGRMVGLGDLLNEVNFLRFSAIGSSYPSSGFEGSVFLYLDELPSTHAFAFS